MRRRYIAFMLHVGMMTAPSITSACGSQARTAEAAQAEPAAEGSEAARTAGTPIGGIVVKGGQNPGPKGKVEAPLAPSQGKSIGEQGVRGEIAPAEPAAREGGRTYTGGRRNEDAPTPAAAPAASSDTPSRLSMTPTSVKAVAPPAAGLNKRSISEKGVK